MIVRQRFVLSARLMARSVWGGTSRIFPWWTHTANESIQCLVVAHYNMLFNDGLRTRVVSYKSRLLWLFLCRCHLFLQLCLLLRCQHLVQLGHHGLVELLHLRLFLVLVERSIRHHGLVLSLCIREDVLDLCLLVVRKIQAVESALQFVMRSHFLAFGLG